ncbi:hypothetical protein NPIL_125011 [Nephila pilipes]|uniref:Uncharacterized protein n=1 Tax=Nephila pilipes TaxID=299642 RepID=A0A8X6U363_NEPPI|nr:hypothetical protein NPIL_391241 [Nephila pilipes]GFU02197.1 hypothetical protein NPIL_125011 [Nephila pilipes]
MIFMGLLHAIQKFSNEESFRNELEEVVGNYCDVMKGSNIENFLGMMIQEKGQTDSFILYREVHSIWTTKAQESLMTMLHQTR